MATRLARRKSNARLWCDALEPRVTPAAVPVIDFHDGFSGPHGAEIYAGPPKGHAPGQLVLTGGPHQGAAAWDRIRVDVRAFQTTFIFQQGDADPATYWSKGDGFTFALASDFPPTFGAAGEGLGYQGLANSVAIKFDLVDNAGEGSNSVGVYTGGAAPTAPATSLDGTGIDLHSGHPFRADIAYDGVALTLTLTDTTAPDHTWTGNFAVDIPGALGASTGYVGFTAGTGELFALQTIKTWTYTEATPSPALNRPPAIMTAAKVILETPTSVVLGGGATDDGGADNLTYTWTVISTPGGASPRVEPISSPDYPTAAARHSRPDRRLHLPVHRPRRPGADRDQFRPSRPRSDDQRRGRRPPGGDRSQ